MVDLEYVNARLDKLEAWRERMEKDLQELREADLKMDTKLALIEQHLEIIAGIGKQIDQVRTYASETSVQMQKISTKLNLYFKFGYGICGALIAAGGWLLAHPKVVLAALGLPM